MRAETEHEKVARWLTTVLLWYVGGLVVIGACQAWLAVLD